jgi:glycosyltransferase involved in cell wall biosynthesis
MASGLPCVASKTGGMPDILANNVTGFLVERGSVEALTNALRTLATDVDTRERMGREARRRAEEHFDWSMAAARLETLYRQHVDAPLGESVPVSNQAPVAAP